MGVESHPTVRLLGHLTTFLNLFSKHSAQRYTYESDSVLFYKASDPEKRLKDLYYCQRSPADT